MGLQVTPETLDLLEIALECWFSGCAYDNTDQGAVAAALRTRPGFDFGMLSQLHFPNGNTAMVHPGLVQDPSIVHFNYLVNTDVKIQCMKVSRDWLVDDSMSSCDWSKATHLREEWKHPVVPTNLADSTAGRISELKWQVSAIPPYYAKDIQYPFEVTGCRSIGGQWGKGFSHNS